MIAAIDWGHLGQLLWAAPVATILVSVVFALVILGASRAQDALRDQASFVAGAYSLMALVALAAFFALVVLGVSVITAK